MGQDFGTERPHDPTWLSKLMPFAQKVPSTNGDEDNESLHRGTAPHHTLTNGEVEGDEIHAYEPNTWSPVLQNGSDSSLAREPTIGSQGAASLPLPSDSGLHFYYPEAIANTYLQQRDQCRGDYDWDSVEASRDNSANSFTPVQSTGSESSGAAHPFQSTSSQRDSVVHASRLNSFTPSTDDPACQQVTPGQPPSFNGSGRYPVASSNVFEDLGEQWSTTNAPYEDNRTFPTEGNARQHWGPAPTSYRDQSAFPTAPPPTSGPQEYPLENLALTGSPTSVLPYHVQPAVQFDGFSLNDPSNGGSYPSILMPPSANGTLDSLVPLNFDFSFVAGDSSVAPFQTAPEQISSQENDEHDAGCTLEIVPYEHKAGGAKKRRQGIQIADRRVWDPVFHGALIKS